MQIDPNKYLALIEHFDIPLKEKRQLIHTIYRIVERFVDVAFGDTPETHVVSSRYKKAFQRKANALGFKKLPKD